MCLKMGDWPPISDTYNSIWKIMINHGNYIKIIQNQHLAFVKLNVVPRNGVPLYASFTLSPSLSLFLSIAFRPTVLLLDTLLWGFHMKL